MNTAGFHAAGYRRGRGFSLVELMVAAALGISLATGALGMYLTAKRQFLLNDQVARLQENGRYALSRLEHEIMLAGFYGGAWDRGQVPEQLLANDCAEEAWALSAALPFDHVGNWAGGGELRTASGIAIDCIPTSTVMPQTDLVLIKRSAAKPAILRGVVDPMLVPSDVASWFLQDVDGESYAWVQTSTRDLLQPGAVNAGESYWKASSSIFYVRRYSRLVGDNIPTLCSKMLAGGFLTTRCHVEGVEDVQLEFGLDENGDGVVDSYVENPSSAQLEAATSVQLFLLLRSIEPVADYRNVTAYSLGSKTHPPALDGYVRRVFSTSVPFRNLRSISDRLDG